jgi:membrane protein implicated in regulation of membrane protease activity
MGSREWAAIASEDLEAGAEAVIIAIEGNALRVQRKTE